MISAVASTMALYFASVVERDIIFCFLEHHEIKFGPRNTATLQNLLKTFYHRHNLPNQDRKKR
jgi:hypothetical protein